MKWVMWFFESVIRGLLEEGDVYFEEGDVVFEEGDRGCFEEGEF